MTASPSAPPRRRPPRWLAAAGHAALLAATAAVLLFLPEAHADRHVHRAHPRGPHPALVVEAAHRHRLSVKATLVSTTRTLVLTS